MSSGTVRRLRFELAAMVLVVALAIASIVATFGSARDGHLVFCHLVDGSVVVGATTDCDEAAPGEPAPDTVNPSRVSVVGSSPAGPGTETVG